MKTKTLKMIKTICLAALVLFMVAGIFSCKTDSSQELKEMRRDVDKLRNEIPKRLNNIYVAVIVSCLGVIGTLGITIVTAFGSK